MTGTQVTVRGAAQLARTLDTFAGDIQQLTAAHTAAGAAVCSRTRARTARLTGALAASWTARVDPHGVTVASPLPYAGKQERRRHALHGGLDDAADDVGRIYTAAVRAAMGKVRGA